MDAILAVSKNGVIGSNGVMPWSIRDYPEDMSRFRNVTIDRYVVMGRKTYESIPKVNGEVLPERFKLVLSSKQIIDKNVLTFSDIETLNQFIKFFEYEGSIVLIGGGSLYKYYINQTNMIRKLYVTVIDKEFEGDTHFDINNLPSSYQLSKIDVRDALTFRTYFNVSY